MLDPIFYLIINSMKWYEIVSLLLLLVYLVIKGRKNFEKNSIPYPYYSFSLVDDARNSGVGDLRRRFYLKVLPLFLSTPLTNTQLVLSTFLYY
jgi:hypothetical protein